MDNGEGRSCLRWPSIPSLHYVCGVHSGGGEAVLHPGVARILLESKLRLHRGDAERFCAGQIREEGVELWKQPTEDLGGDL